MRDQSPPACGVSTLMTSAPCCASIMAQEGPATPPVRSMTLTPAKALSQSMSYVRFRPVDLVRRVPGRGHDDNASRPAPHGPRQCSHVTVTTGRPGAQYEISARVKRRSPRQCEFLPHQRNPVFNAQWNYFVIEI